MSDEQNGDTTSETSERPRAGAPADPDLARTASGLARIYATAWWRTAGWTVETSLRAARHLLGAIDTDGRIQRATSKEPAARRGRDVPPGGGATISSLRERGAELLRRSADVDFEEETHPAYARILEDLAPDEGRILRSLAIEGPQPAVDVRTARPLNIGSELVAPGLSMIAEQAGCRHLDRTHAYLNNLYRLGLIWFSREPLPDPLSYQVLEAQPDVLEAMRGASRARTVRRSIHLTPFGEDFCKTCLPLETAELDALPGADEP